MKKLAFAVAALILAFTAATPQPVRASQQDKPAPAPVVDNHPTYWPWFWHVQKRCASGCSFNPNYYIPYCWDGSQNSWSSSFRNPLRRSIAVWNAQYTGGIYLYESADCGTLDAGGWHYISLGYEQISGNIAYAAPTATQSTSQIWKMHTCKIHFDSDVDWYYGNEGRKIGVTEVDIQSAALHELGHCMMLDHSHHGEDIMWASLCYFGGNAGCIQHTLSANDIEGYHHHG